MDRDGHNLIKQALSVPRPRIEAVVTPLPGPDEDVRFVTIRTSDGLAPEAVLNALAHALLLTGDEEARNRAMHEERLSGEAPELRPMGPQPGSITFEDHNRVNPAQAV